MAQIVDRNNGVRVRLPTTYELTTDANEMDVEDIDHVWSELEVVDALSFDAVDGEEDASALSLKVVVPDDKQAVVLMERDGWMEWVPIAPAHPGLFADEEEDPGELFKLAGPQHAGLFDGWIGKKIRAVVFQFAIDAIAGMTTKMAVRFLERKLRRGPVHITGADVEQWRHTDDLSHLSFGANAKVLLLIHGTFSSCLGSFGGLAATSPGQKLLRGWLARYDAVIGFDHPTLSESPRQNAKEIWTWLQSAHFDGVPHFDVVCYSRGGLVTRTLLDVSMSEPWRKKLGTAAFVAATNGGTRIAHPTRWKQLVDISTNAAAAGARVASVINPTWAGAAAVLSGGIRGIGVLVQATTGAALRGKHAPGLASMDPKGSFIEELNGSVTGSHGRFIGATSNFEPGGVLAGGGEDATLLEKTTGLPVQVLKKLADGAVDTFMNEPNDLVVHNDSVLEVGPHRVMKSEDHLRMPENATTYHTNFFYNEEFIRWLAMNVRPATGTGGALVDDANKTLRDAADEIKILLRGPIDDAVMDRIHQLDEKFDGAADLAAAELIDSSASAPPDTFSAKTELAKIEKTASQRWAYDRKIEAPSTLRDVVELLSDQDTPIRVVGSAGSLSRASTPGKARLVATCNLGGVLPIDSTGLLDSGQHDRLYRCGAGRTIRGIIGDLNDHTTPAGDWAPRALANLGGGSFQTLAGIFSTASHGSGLGLGGFPSLVASLLVATFDATGNIAILRVERASAPVTDKAKFPFKEGAALKAQLPEEVVVDIVHDDEIFDAHVVGLGCLGFVFSATMHVRPQYWLQESRTIEPWDDVQDEMLADAASLRHVEVMVDPWPDANGKYECLVTRRFISDVHRRKGHRPPGMYIATTPLALPIAGSLMEAAVKKPLKNAKKRTHTSLHSTQVSYYNNLSDKVLRLNLNVASLSSEYCVPVNDAPKAVNKLLEQIEANRKGAAKWLQDHPDDVAGMWENHPVPTGPIALRFVAPTDGLMSPQRGRASCQIEYHFPGSRRLDVRIRDTSDQAKVMKRYRAFDKGRRKAMRAAERLLASDFSGRAHWGLYNEMTQAEARDAFPDFDTWLAHYDVANASGIFNNPLTKQLDIDR